MAKDKIYSWIGGAKSMEPQTDASTATTDVIQLIPAVPTGGAAGDTLLRTRFLIEAIYLHFSVVRVLTTDFDALGFLVYQIPPVEASNLPSLALDALSLNPRLYARKNIMMMAPLEVPPVLGASDLATFTLSGRHMVAHHEYQAMRKHDTASQVLAMTINSDVSVVVNVFAQWRVLVSWT